MSSLSSSAYALSSHSLPRLSQDEPRSNLTMSSSYHTRSTGESVSHSTHPSTLTAASLGTRKAGSELDFDSDIPLERYPTTTAQSVHSDHSTQTGHTGRTAISLTRTSPGTAFGSTATLASAGLVPTPSQVEHGTQSGRSTARDERRVLGMKRSTAYCVGGTAVAVAVAAGFGAGIIVGHERQHRPSS